MGIANTPFCYVGNHQRQDPKFRAEHFASSAPGAFDEELQVVVAAHEFGNVFRHDSLVQFAILLLVPLDEESPRPPQQDMHDGHIKEILSSCDVRAFHPIPKEDVAHDQEVDVAAMRGDDYQGAFIRLVVAL
jgi:hypothetical protein